MCGIAGIVDNERDKKGIMEKMLKRIAHRGPDASALYEWENTIIGHCRLSIVDPEKGTQPFHNPSGTLSVVFNGEIYNFKELKKEAEEKGIEFRTESDTEVILALYEAYGPDFITRLNGIFSFAVLDKRDGSLMLARDYFGIKPLHYFHENGILVFGSEIKALLEYPGYRRETDYDTMHRHLNLRYSPGNDTLFKHIKRMPPATYAIYKAGRLDFKRYWHLKPETRRDIGEEEAKADIDRLLLQAVKRQLPEGIPVGVYLSGGLDSSIIVRKMCEAGVKDILSFTLGFDEPGDESEAAAHTASFFGTRHHNLKIDPHPMELMPRVIYHAEEPKINLIQGYHMSAFARSSVKVVMSGIGGDELFAGYDIHKLLRPLDRISSHIPGFMKKAGCGLSSALFRLHRATGPMKWDEYRRGLQMLFSAGDIEKAYLILRNTWDYDKGCYREIYNPAFLENLNGEREKTHRVFDGLFGEIGNLTPLEKVMYAEFHTKMVNDYLLVDDRMSMANGIEERAPLLDKDLAEYAFSLPVSLKMKGKRTKGLLRETVGNSLPEGTANKKKQGFSANPYLMFKRHLKPAAERILTEDFVRKQGIFRYEYIQKILKHRPDPRLRWHYNYIWLVLGFAIWEEIFIKGNMSDDIEAYYH